MLKSFQIDNFNSIKDPIIFSMEAETELTEKPEYINELDENSKLLRVASIYGPNASGKSTLLSAIHFIKDIASGRLSKENPIIRDYLSERISRETARRRYSNYFSFAPFKFTSEENGETNISIVFARRGIEYGYRVKVEFVINDDSLIKVKDEFFGVKKENEKSFDLVFSKKDNVISANKILKIIGASKLPISNDMTILRHLIVNYVDANTEPYDEKNQDHLKYVSDLYEEIQSLRLITNLSASPVRVFSHNGTIIEDNKEFIIKSLQSLDIHITDIIVEDLSRIDKLIYCVHEINGKTYKLRLEQESQGTQLLMYLLSMIASRKNNPTVFLIDELDSHLHPKLVREIIRLFNSKVNHCNQLIFNSHDMWNMVPEQFRRDQVWFTYRNDELSTELLCLSDVINYKGERVRKHAKNTKQYMEGKYGADPFIRKGLDWYEL
jgi:AAA15 family ATPase/GTPase